MVADHVAKRRASMLAEARKIPDLGSPAELVSAGEEHVCSLLLDLHQRGPIPEDHFSWLIDQWLARSIEARRPHMARRVFALLGTVPSTRADYTKVAASAVWSRYEAEHKDDPDPRDGLRVRSTSSSSSASSSAEETNNGKKTTYGKKTINGKQTTNGKKTTNGKAITNGK